MVEGAVGAGPAVGTRSCSGRDVHCAVGIGATLWLLLNGCASHVTGTELRVRDPWQIALEKPGGRVLLPAGAPGDVWGALYRDEDGFPHYLRSAGHYELVVGTLVVTDTTPTLDRGMVKIPARLYRHATCHRPLRPCSIPNGHIVFITPVPNVTMLDTR